ncbi:ubiquitin-conjugating enzyme E2 Z [Rhipicephalus microplus]|uniref:ubiquitin-conjugating enzyme E2 Z n=1 Tax=Rhipicephalus microplus TaxID=6941 RepID=UPI003F6C383B
MATTGEDAMSDVKEVKFTPDLNFWDPTAPRQLNVGTPSDQCLHKVRRDILDVYALPISGVVITPVEKDVTRIHGLLLGPPGTPYEGGFFRFVLKCPPDFPARPPLVKLLTTGDGQVRFAPNLNEDGMVCLSLLGTWPGPVWNSSVHSLRTVLIALQSIMMDEPYHNVPSLVKGRTDDTEAYNDYLLHETLRVAVGDEVEAALDPASSYAPELRKVVLRTFVEMYDTYVETVRLQMGRMVREGTDPFGGRTIRFEYDDILTRLRSLYDIVFDLNETGFSDRVVD